MLAMCAGLLFFSCMQPFDGTVQSSSGLSLIITNYSQNSDSSRAISPGTFAPGNVKKYIIEGEDLDGEKLQPKVITINPDGTGEIGKLKNSVWSFILHAYSDEAGTNEVLCGYSSVDSRYITVVSFVLSSEGVNVDGTYDISLKYKASANDAVTFADAVKEVSVSLCNPQTLEPVSDFPKTMRDSTKLEKWTSSDGYNLSGSLPAGYYYLLVTFRGTDPNNYPNLCDIGFYSDFIDIQPGRETSVSEPIEISGVLYQKPSAPDNLKVYRVEDSLNQDYYNAVLTWEDNSVNEEYFKINVYQYDNT